MAVERCLRRRLEPTAMTDRDYSFFYDGTPVFDYVKEQAPAPTNSHLDDPFYVYLMGPYTAFDATYAFNDADKLDTPFINDPLFDPDEHLDSANRATYEAALADLCQSLRDGLGVHAYLASDITGIPTVRDAIGSQPGMSVLDQSVAFSAVSDAVIFVFSKAGLTTGTGSEVGTILSDFNLRRENPEPDRKPRDRMGIFIQNEFTSASINEIPYTFDIPTREFGDKESLHRKIRHFLANIERELNAGHLPVYTPYR